MRVDTFQEFLSDAEEYCNDNTGWNFIEHVYYSKLKGVQVNHFRYYPQLSGIIGMNGQDYDRSKSQMIIKNLLLRFGYYNYGKKSILSNKVIENLEAKVSRILK